MRTDCPYELSGKRVWVAGHNGMVGSAVVRRLKSEDCEIVTVPRQQLDLLRQDQVEAWLAENKPDAIVLAAALVGGIHVNDTYPADFIYRNLMIEANVIEAAFRNGVEKLLFLGSSCIYPRLAPQPMPEAALLTGPLEPTNEWYAVAKIAGVKLAQAFRRQHGCDFISAMPANLYGPGDNFDPGASHVIPALIRRAHEAKVSGATEMDVWGSGKPMREFLHVDDCADALVFLMRNYSAAEPVNVGSGEEQTIAELAQIVAEVVGFQGELVFDRSKPDGAPRKLMSAVKLRDAGWAPKIGLRDGIRAVYAWFLANQAAAA